MTINEILDQGISIEGAVEIRQWGHEEIIEQLNYDDFLLEEDRTNKLYYLQIYYMFANNGKLIFEVRGL